MQRPEAHFYPPGAPPATTQLAARCCAPDRRPTLASPLAPVDAAPASGAARQRRRAETPARVLHRPRQHSHPLAVAWMLAKTLHEFFVADPVAAHRGCLHPIAQPLLGHTRSDRTRSTGQRPACPTTVSDSPTRQRPGAARFRDRQGGLHAQVRAAAAISLGRLRLPGSAGHAGAQPQRVACPGRRRRQRRQALRCAGSARPSPS